MGKAELLRDLREQAGLSSPVLRKEFWTAPQLPCGVPRGIVVELLGNARTEWLLEFFSGHPHHPIFWCENGRGQCVNPVAIHQRSVNLSRIKFIYTESDLQQPLRMALETKSYPFIVAPNSFAEVRIFQRLHLLAEKSKCTLFLLAAKKFSLAWPISLQLEIQFSDGGYQLNVQRQRFR